MATNGVVATIARVATSLGIPVPVALAIADQESGIDPTNIGDGGTSFGLYQLHEGGELGNHTAAWAFDPTNNATTSLSVLASVHAANPSLDWGAAAAAAQRPADPAGYAASVRSLIAKYGGATGDAAAAEKVATGQATAPSSSSAGGSTSPGYTTAAYTGGGVSGAISDVAGTALGLLFPGSGSVLQSVIKGGTYVVLTVAGAGLVVLGLAKAAGGSSGDGGGRSQSQINPADVAALAAVV